MTQREEFVPVPYDQNLHGSREDGRLAALEHYDVLDTPSEERFDRITRLTRRLFNVSMSTITFLDGHRQWFKSKEGVESSETARGSSFCTRTISQNEPLIIPDTLADERFRDNPHVVGGGKLRFYAGVSLCTPDGHAIGTLCAMDTKPREFLPDEVEALKDLAHVVMDELELRNLATIDELTGALTRRAIRSEGARALALSVRHRHDLSCIMLDLDHFKAVNDTFGHSAGDAVLRETVATCRENTRSSDLLGRIGGEEFALLLPHTGGDAAMQVAEKLRAAIARQHADNLDCHVPISASLGVATFDSRTGDFEALLERADKALYLAKEDGRNRCVAWREPEAHIAPSSRRRVLKAGRISFNFGHSAIDCTVRSLSEEGAGVDVISSAGIPEHFRLHIESDDIYRHCHIVEKKDRHIEVEFERAMAAAA